MKKILVVDDEKSILEAVGFILNDAGYEVDARLDIGIEKVKKHLPDLILLDVRLCGKDGRDIARELKQNSDTKHIPVIMISASPIDAKSIKTYGADDFLQKPFDIDFLLKSVKRYL